MWVDGHAPWYCCVPRGCLQTSSRWGADCTAHSVQTVCTEKGYTKWMTGLSTAWVVKALEGVAAGGVTAGFMALTQGTMGCHSAAELPGSAHFEACCRGSWGQGSLEILLPRRLSMGYSPSHPGDQEWIKIKSLYDTPLMYKSIPVNTFPCAVSSLHHPGFSNAASGNDFLHFTKWLGNTYWNTEIQ